MSTSRLPPAFGFATRNSSESAEGRSVRVITTCTNLKRPRAAPRFQLRSIGNLPLHERLHAWVDRLRKDAGRQVRVQDLYSGDHWKVARSLPEAGAKSGLKVEVWVSSAGYGLISPAAVVHPYDATFSPAEPDTVARETDEEPREVVARRWWEGLAQWEGPMPGTPRSIADLAALDPSAPLIFAASPPYVIAALNDLRAAADILSDPALLVVVSGGLTELPGMELNLLPADARLQAEVKGPLGSLNIRIAEKIITEAEQHGFDARSLSEHYTGLLQSLPEPTRYAREPQTDEQVRRYIRDRLREDPSARHSTLHRRLRNEGRACEQTRFRTLFFEVREELSRGTDLRTQLSIGL